MIELKLQQNARTPDLGFETDRKCGFCGCVSSAYLEITIATQFRNKEVICKGCLSLGADIIDEGILEQTKKRV